MNCDTLPISERCLNVVKKCLESNDFTSQESLSASLKDAATKLDVPFKQLIALTRLALTGVKVRKWGPKVEHHLTRVITMYVLFSFI